MKRKVSYAGDTVANCNAVQFIVLPKRKTFNSCDWHSVDIFGDANVTDLSSITRYRNCSIVGRECKLTICHHDHCKQNQWRHHHFHLAIMD